MMYKYRENMISLSEYLIMSINQNILKKWSDNKHFILHIDVPFLLRKNNS